jgi:arylsulfatase A-like enzyme
MRPVQISGPLIGALALVCTTQGPPIAPTVPHIVVILADDLGYGDVGFQNSDAKTSTPRLDALAKESVVCTHAYAPSAVCSPSRYALLTGRYAWRTRLKQRVVPPWDKPLIEAGRLTLPALLARHGYDTAAIGKWHLGWDWPTTDGARPSPLSSGETVDFAKRVGGGPTERGFARFFGFEVSNYPPYCFLENDHTVGIPSERNEDPGVGRAGLMVKGWQPCDILPQLTAHAVEYIEQRAAHPDEPFFLYLALNAPHPPIAPSAEFAGKSPAGPYGDFVAETDAAIGRVLDALERTDLASHTLVIVTSDNGSYAPDSSEQDEAARAGHRSNGPLRGGKSEIWEGGVRVPFLARWPGHIRAGSASDETICLVDLMATVANLIGEALPADAAEDSCDVGPALLGAPHATPLREATVLTSGLGIFAVYRGRWKLILGEGSGGYDAPEPMANETAPAGGQLYDLDADLGETHNVFAQHPDVVAELKALLHRYRKSGHSVEHR